MIERETAMIAASERRTLFFYLGLPLVVLSACATSCSSCKKEAGTAPEARGSLTPGASITIPTERAAYVTNNGSDSISVFDRDGDSVTSVPLDLDPDAHEAPHHIAVDSAAKKAFVVLAFPPAAGARKGPHASHGGATDLGKLARLDLGTLAIESAEDVDENPGDVILTRDHRRVVVTHFDMKRAMDVAARGGASPATMFAHLTVFDAHTMKRLGSRAICTAPHGVAVTGDGKTAYVACYGSDEIAVVDLESEGFPTSRVPLGATPGVPGVPRYGPYSTTLSPDETRVVVADLEGQDIRIFDRASRRFVVDKTVPLAAKAFMPAFADGTRLLVPTQAPDGLVLVDVEGARVEKRATFSRTDCALPHVVRTAKDGRAYLVCEGDHTAAGTVLEIDKTTLATKRKWTMGVNPDGIAFGDD